MLETSCKVGLQPEGAHCHLETVILVTKFVSFETEKRQQQSFGIN